MNKQDIISDIEKFVLSDLTVFSRNCRFFKVVVRSTKYPNLGLNPEVF